MIGKITVIHIVNDYSGASKYSKELLAASLHNTNFNFIYLYTSSKEIQELVIETTDCCSIINIPVLNYKSTESKLRLFMNILSLYVSCNSHIIYHDNGNNLLTKKFIDSNKLQSQFVHTMHFIPLNVDISKHPILDSLDSVIYVTKYAKEYLVQKKHYIDRVIYNGVQEVIINKTKKTIRTKYSFENKECLILYVGRIEESKGVTFLTNVFSGIGLENVRLVIVGSGAYDLIFEKIEANHSKITFLGNIDNIEVHNLMAACDIGVIPSLNEQCSYVALEMMSHGMAIIASEVRGMGEIFIGKDIALTVPVDYTEDIPMLDTDVLKQHIITLATDGKLRKRLGERARREWAEHYTAERMARETMEVYRELAAQF